MPLENIKGLESKPRLLAEEISQSLTEAILEGRLKGGDQLVETELQKIFGVSRSPLREAFRDLEKKGLVVIVPRRGTFVKSVTIRDVQEVFPVRAALEGLAAGLAQGVMTEKERAALMVALTGMEQAARENDLKTYRQHHLEFHQIFIQGCKVGLLTDLLDSLRMHSMWFQFSYQQYQEDLDRSLDYHRRILSLFLDPARPVREVEEAVRSHILAYMEMFISFIRDQEGRVD